MDQQWTTSRNLGQNECLENLASYGKLHLFQSSPNATLRLRASVGGASYTLYM